MVIIIVTSTQKYFIIFLSSTLYINMPQAKIIKRIGPIHDLSGNSGDSVIEYIEKKLPIQNM